MKIQKIGKGLRLFFLVIASLMWLGIWLTGFNLVHWVLYVPAVFLVFAAATGICPGILFSNRLFGTSD